MNMQEEIKLYKDEMNKLIHKVDIDDELNDCEYIRIGIKKYIQDVFKTRLIMYEKQMEIYNKWLTKHKEDKNGISRSKKV